MTRSVQVSIAAALLGCAAASYAQQQPAPASETVDEVVVTGFRASLQSSTEAKRQSVGFVDAIFSEDIGKFPDTNLAESFNRIPGVNISRDITGEGLQVAIRGLNTNFTRVLLNGAPVAIASTGQDNAAQNREVDLDLFPSELFSQLTVAKTTSADMLEGGAAGTINMRMARPFDHEGMNLTYQIQGVDNANADSRGARGSLLFSNTWGAFGALVGVAGVQNKVATTGFETIGWTSMNLTQDQCGFNPMGQALPCNATGGAGAGPGTITSIPNNSSTIAAGFTPGNPVDQAFLLAQNPNRTMTEIDNAVFPRLGRPMFDVGDKDRYNGVVSFEFRPSDDLHFYMDNMYGKKENDLERADLMWAVRRTSQGGLVIPQNLQVDNPGCVTGCVVTSGTFVNSQLMLEYRPYLEETEFWGTNPGMTWTINDQWSLDVQGNYTESDFYSEVPTVLVLTQPTTVTYTNDGSGNPVISSGLDLNNPANYTWLIPNRGGGNETGRVDLTAQERKTETMGGRFSLTWGDTDLNLKFGASYDDVSRDIRPLNNTQQWQNAVCGGNPSVFVPAPNTQPPCRGLSAAEIAQANAAALAANPTAAPPFPTYHTYNGSLIPNSAVPNYLVPTEYGFVSVDWNAFARDSNYAAIRDQMGEGGATPTTANWGTIAEEVTGAFLQLNGDTEVAENRFRYNVGVRYVQTDQTVISRLTAQDTRNVVPGTNPPVLIPDGTRFADVVNLVELDTDYRNWLPSANVAWNVTDNFLVRGGFSKTMTRANPADMLLGLSIPNADVSSVNLGNPDLDPYESKNFDLGFEYYTGREGFFGVAAFRKALEGFTTRQATIITFGDLAQFGVTLESLGQGQRDAVNGRGGNNALVTLNQTVNASGQLTINGLEFTWVQPLDFALERFGLGGLGFTANYTVIDQKGEGAAPAIAIGVPPETYNATLYYEKFGISARVSVTSALGSQGSGPNSNQSQINGAELFGEDYTQWDFSSSFDFAEMFGWSDFAPQLTIDVINLDDAVRRSYFQFPNATFTEFNSGRTVMVGLRGRF
jgi:TonB-dependent receptor